jgi:hypothetical protein
MIIKRIKFEMTRSHNEQAAVLRIEGRKLWRRFTSRGLLGRLVIRHHVKNLERGR